ncbi:MAG: hypothetical protein ABI614_26355 [Planctomycetota bacterium]
MKFERRNAKNRQQPNQPDKFYDWKQRDGKVNEHNGWIPRDHWLTPLEKQAILAFQHQHPLEGYRRLTFGHRPLGWSAYQNVALKAARPLQPRAMIHRPFGTKSEQLRNLVRC